MSAIDEQALAQSFGDERIAIDREFDAEHEAFGADFADEIEFAGELAESFSKLRAASANIFEKFLVFQDF